MLFLDFFVEFFDPEYFFFNSGGFGFGILVALVITCVISWFDLEVVNYFFSNLLPPSLGFVLGAFFARLGAEEFAAIDGSVLG